MAGQGMRKAALGPDTQEASCGNRCAALVGWEAGPAALGLGLGLGLLCEAPFLLFGPWSRPPGHRLFILLPRSSLHPTTSPLRR